MNILIDEKAKKLIYKKSVDKIITLGIYQPNNC